MMCRIRIVFVRRQRAAELKNIHAPGEHGNMGFSNEKAESPISLYTPSIKCRNYLKAIIFLSCWGQWKP